MERENNKENIDEGIKFVHKTISHEVENGIVIAAYMDKNSSLIDCACFAKGEANIVFSILKVGVIKMLDDFGFNLNAYIKELQQVSYKRKKK